jgi:hypothetical protein
MGGQLPPVGALALLLTRSRTSRTRALIVSLVALATLVPLATAGAAPLATSDPVPLGAEGPALLTSAGSARSLDAACPPHLQVATFGDVPATSAHRTAVACMAGWGVARGHADGTFRPRNDVSRAQVATFLHRLLVATDLAPEPGLGRFDDVPSGHTHETAVNALASAGVIQGTSSTTFSPDLPVTRGQMASLLVRTHERLTGEALVAGPVTLLDIAGDTHEAAISKLSPLGIVTGHPDGTYRPRLRVTREQLASFLARYADLLVEQGRATVPAVATNPAPGGQDREEATVQDPFGGGRHFGVATPSNAWDNGELAQVTAAVGQRPSIVLHYLGFGDELQPQQLRNVVDWGAMPFLTWEPFDWRAAHTTDQPEYALRHLIDGRFDAYLTRTARTLAAFEAPVLLRFAHEMNGDWYPWSEQVNGNRRGEYVAAWRHVHDLFGRLGVDNVHWVWSPNVEFPGSAPLTGLYPGDAFVDVIALDGYNWGSTALSGWQSPSQVFGPTLEAVRRLAPGVPLMIGETASAELGGSKANWNTALFAWLTQQPDIGALVWFHLDKETDWRLDSSPMSAAAFAEGLGRWLQP